MTLHLPPTRPVDLDEIRPGDTIVVDPGTGPTTIVVAELTRSIDGYRLAGWPAPKTEGRKRWFDFDTDDQVDRVDEYDVVVDWDQTEGALLGAVIVCRACSGSGDNCETCSGNGRLHRPYPDQDGDVEVPSDGLEAVS